MVDSILLRPFRPEDLKGLAEAELLEKQVYDPDFGVQVMAPWAFTRREISRLVNQEGGHSSYMTKSYVLVGKTIAECCDGLWEERDWICGGFILELQPTAMEVVLLTIHPEADQTECLFRIAEWLKDKSLNSRTRRKIFFHLADSVSVPVNKLLPFWKNQDFTIKLINNHFPAQGCITIPTDAWCCTYEADQEYSGRNKDEEGELAEVGG